MLVMDLHKFFTCDSQCKENNNNIVKVYIVNLKFKVI